MNVAKTKTKFVCQNCDYSSPRYLGRCPNCGEWNTMVEEVITPAAAKPQSTRTTVTGEHSKPQLMNDIKHTTEMRVKTQMNELNRVLGGGIVPGSLILIGGDPGIGKSTLLLQVSGQLSATGGKVLYVSGEESASQIKMRADRLVVNSDNLYLYPETDMASIRANIEEMQPDYVVIDSCLLYTSPSPRDA